MDDSAQLRSAYVKATGPRRVEHSRIGCIAALIFMPLGGIVDFFVYPENLTEIFTARLICEFAIIFIYPLHHKSGIEKHVKILNLSFPLLIIITLCWVIRSTEGINGPYYAGLSMLILGVSLLLPLTFFETLIFVLFTISCYLLFGLWGVTDKLVPSLVINNLYFLSATGIIACTSSYFSEIARYREFGLTYQLDERNKKLAELDKRKNDFIANISHEFRTPLTLILAPIEDLLHARSGSSSEAKHLDYIRNNTYRLLKLVNDLLDVLKLEEEKENFIEKHPFRLNALLTSLCANTEFLAKAKGVDLAITEPSKVVTVNGDFSELEKVFTNLLSNAIKFTESGGEISVSMEILETSVEVSVCDTGPGIAEKDIPYIFDRFHQVDSSATRKHQGTGLGLALVKEVVELHGGDVRVRSIVGQGTTMIVVLPTIDAPVGSYASDINTAADQLDRMHQRAALFGGLGEKKVDHAESGATIASSQDPSDDRPSMVIVEDESGIRDYLIRAFSKDYQIQWAENGATGLDLICASKPDLVITDLMLPEIDGLTICEAVKQDESLYRTKLMLLTARTDDKSKINALKLGADDFLTKPFSTVEIRSRIANLWRTTQLQVNVERQNRELSEALLELKNTQSKLIQSEKLNALGKMSAGLLHEINNPLNFIFGSFQLLEREPAVAGDSYAMELMADMREGIERITGIVRDLKTFAYPEATDLGKHFDMQSTVASATRFTSSSIAVNVKLTSDIPSMLVVGSQSHIVQVLVNLIQNASDAMEDANTENPWIQISREVLADKRIRIIVEDNGPGVPDEIKGKVFDPFYTTKDVGAGMGMGLSICHTIIKNHGGHLELESVPGNTRFIFDLAQPDIFADNQAVDINEEEKQ